MTTIEKLGISGIRSYGPDDEQLIKFYKPLTIILGQNGSGKSTIIEAVKMATTGDLPPMVSQGAAFINDPRIRSMTETNAKIRLQFTNVRGEEYLVSRHFLLKMSRSGKPEFKTVDQTLKRNRSRRKRRRRRRADGEDDGDEGQDEEDEDDRRGNSTSHRCAELNALLPDLMRVTKPILNSVIFVHQEDSLWPLGDPKQLKERFDDIFSATRYTKALESIRKFQKGQATELRVVNSELLLHEDRAKACEKLREEAKEIREKEAKLRAGVDAIQAEIAGLKRELGRARGIEAEHTDLQAKLTSLDAKVGVHERNRDQKYATLTECLDTLKDDVLEKLIDDLDDAMRRSEGEKRDRAAGLEKFRNEMEGTSKTYNDLQKRYGAFQEEAYQQKQRLEELEKLKRQFQKLFFTGAESQASLVDQVPAMESGYDVWSAALGTLRDQSQNKVQSVTGERREVEDAAAAKLSDVQLRLSAARSEMERKREQASEKRSLTAQKRNELRGLLQGTSQEDVNAAKVEEAECEKATARVRASDKIPLATAELNAAKSSALRLQQKVQTLKLERKSLAQDHEYSVAMHQRRSEYIHQQKQLTLSSEDLLEKAKPICDYHAIKIDGDDIGDCCEVGCHDNIQEALAQEKAQENALQLVSGLVRFRDRVTSEAEKKLRATTTIYSAAKTKGSDRDYALSQAEEDLRLEEKVLAKVYSELTDDMRSVIEDATLMAKTLTRLDGGRVTMNPGNCSALDEVERTASAKITYHSNALKMKESTAASATKTLENFRNNGYCFHCGHEAVLDATVDDSDLVVDAGNKERHKNAQRQAIKAFADRRAAEEKAAQLEWMQNMIRDAGEAATADLSSKLRVAESMVTWARKMIRVGDRVVALASRVSDTKEAASSAESDVVGAKMIMKAAESRSAELELQFGRNSDVQEVVSLRDDLLRLSRDRNNAYKAWQKALGSLPPESASRTMDQVDNEVGEVEQALKKAQDSMDLSRAAIDAAKDERSRVEAKHSQARERVLQLKQDFDLRGRLESEKKDLTEAIRLLEGELEQLRDKLPALEEDFALARSEFDTIRKESARLVQATNTNAGAVAKAFETWSEVLRRVETYMKGGKEADISRCERHMQATKNKLQSLQNDIREVTKDMESASDSIRDKSSELNNAVENQRYRALLKELEMYQAQARDTRTDVEQLVTKATRLANDALASAEARRHQGNAAAGSCGAGSRSSVEGIAHDGEPEERGSAKRDWGGKQTISRMEPKALVWELSEQYSRKNARCHATKGKAQVYTERWALKQREIEEADRLGSMKKYEECRITKQTMELASSDLQRYHRALDQALMSFHALKMDNINKSIRELWQTTYRGNDIDEIEIVSDAGAGDGRIGTTAKRNYNYRVMMRRGDAKLDMRGRCSAGQKVLACLVVRLALAESFCTDCGILALDEPTTNLDRDNVESLAVALRAIIENRRQQAHFQLILISHDESFLSMMSARSFCDSYHLIHKDASGNSVSG
jgi:DNA repair protein RAD50